jgi:hypothetical protein
MDEYLARSQAAQDALQAARTAKRASMLIGPDQFIAMAHVEAVLALAAAIQSVGPMPPGRRE